MEDQIDDNDIVAYADDVDETGDREAALAASVATNAAATEFAVGGGAPAATGGAAGKWPKWAWAALIVLVILVIVFVIWKPFSADDDAPAGGADAGAK